MMHALASSADCVRHALIAQDMHHARMRRRPRGRRFVESRGAGKKGEGGGVSGPDTPSHPIPTCNPRLIAPVVGRVHHLEVTAASPRGSGAALSWPPPRLRLAIASFCLVCGGYFLQHLAT